MKDFTHQIYKKLLETFLEKKYQFIRVQDYFENKFDKNSPFVIMRHDVDRYPKRSLIMAKLENSLGVKATYYFRTIPATFKPEIIKNIVSLKHEIGYHYESLAEANGNYEEAIKDFEYNLARLREFYSVRNIAMHGRPTSKFDSRDLWKKYNYKKYEILSEPYLDLDFNTIFYITDAGRAWGDESINLRDKVDSSFDLEIKSTQNIINLINNNEFPKKVMFNIHPEHWANNTLEWYEIYLVRRVKNYIKRLIIKR